MIEIPEKFDINIFRIWKERHSSDFEKAKDLLHCSDVPFCGRKTVLIKNHNINREMNAAMLFGKIGHFLLQEPETLMELLYEIYNQTGIKINKDSIKSTDKDTEDKWEFIPGRFIYMHPDVQTDKYTLEFKFTTIPKQYWKRELAPYNLSQLNTYIIRKKQELGFIIRIDWRVITSNYKTIKEENELFSKLWEEYGFIMPVYANQELFDITIKRAEQLFIGIDTNDITLFPNCEFEWECGYCPAVEKCGKKSYKCSQYIVNKRGERKKCTKVMYEFPTELTEQFVKEPQCELCFNTQNPHSKYEKLKYRNYKE